MFAPRRQRGPWFQTVFIPAWRYGVAVLCLHPKSPIMFKTQVCRMATKALGWRWAAVRVLALRKGDEIWLRWMAISTGDCKSRVAFLGQGNNELFESSRSRLLERINPTLWSSGWARYWFGHKGNHRGVHYLEGFKSSLIYTHEHFVA